MARKGRKKIICFNCKKPGHIVVECPKNMATPPPPRSHTTEGFKGYMGFGE